MFNVLPNGVLDTIFTAAQNMFLITVFFKIRIYHICSKIVYYIQFILIDVTRNSILNGKTQLIEAVQTKVSYFILLKITYCITNWTPYRHMYWLNVTFITVNLCLYRWVFPSITNYGWFGHFSAQLCFRPTLFGTPFSAQF